MLTEDNIQNKTPTEIVNLHSEILQEKNSIIESKEKIIDALMHENRLLKLNRFGKKSEKLSAEEAVQAELFDEAELMDSNAAELSEANSDDTEVEAIQVEAHKRTRKKGNKKLPDHIERVEKIYDLPEEDKQCSCGCQLTCIDEDIKEELEIIPAKVSVTRHIRKKYTCKACSKLQAAGDESIKVIFKTADGPRSLIPKSIASPSLLSYIITAKYCDHLPLYRQENIFKRIEIELPRISMSRWVITVGEKIIPLINLLQDHIHDYDVSFSDETTVQVLKEPDRSPSSKSYMWVFGGGPPDKRCIIYQYQPSRSGRCAEAFFAGYQGALHVDGYCGYDSITKGTAILRLGCWAHARRKFFEALPNGKMKGIAGKVVRMIGKLYKLEEEYKEKTLSSDKIQEERHSKSKPVLDSIKELLDESIRKVPPQSPIHKAIKYALGQWPSLINYLKDGRYEIDNNRSERAIKPFVIGRKNWIFANSINGATASANLFSLIETAKANGLEPYAYLKLVFEKLPYAESIEDYEALLPFNISPGCLSKS